MNGKNFYLIALLLLATFIGKAQHTGSSYIVLLDDAQLDIGVRLNSIFALDDKAPLSANPHYRAMWNLIKLGSSVEALLQGLDEPLNDLDLSRQFGQNGYNKTVLAFFIRYGFGETDDTKLQQQFLDLSLSSGYFREGDSGMNVHLDYQYNFATTPYGAGGASIERAIDYEFFAGARIGFDWSFQRSDGEVGFFTHLSEELNRIAEENELTASQLIELETMAEDSKILLPEDVGGRSFHIGPIAGGRVSKRIFPKTKAFAEVNGFFDMMDLFDKDNGQENSRSQHMVTGSLGITMTIGGEGSRPPSNHSFF